MRVIVLCVRSCIRLTVLLSSMSCLLSVFLFFKQKTAYEMRISDWSSDVCSSDLIPASMIERLEERAAQATAGVTSNLEKHLARLGGRTEQIGRASCRERVCQYV